MFVHLLPASLLVAMCSAVMFPRGDPSVGGVSQGGNSGCEVAAVHVTSVSVHSLRCQSLVNMAMFRCKKDIVMKYSRTLSDHFKSSSKVAQAPSPCMARHVLSMAKQCTAMSFTSCLCDVLCACDFWFFRNHVIGLSVL